MVRLAFGSCTDDPRSPVWDKITAEKPDALLLLGDNIYLRAGEWRSADSIQRRYETLLQEAGFKRLRSVIPIYAVWDDHDYGPNNADARFSYNSATRTAFKKAWGVQGTPAPLENSIAFSVRIRDVEILMTDNRTFRQNPEGAGEGAYFGAAQLSWIMNVIESTRAKAVVVASGNQILAGGESDQKLVAYPREQAALLRTIECARVPVILLTGDRHYGAIIERTLERRKVVELSSSPLTAKPRSGKGDSSEGETEERRVVSETRLEEKHNYGVLEIETEDPIVVRGRIQEVEGADALTTSVTYPRPSITH